MFSHGLLKLIKGKINLSIRYIKTNWSYKNVNKNEVRTVICNNCVGAMVLHDLGLKFNSPFVNLFIRPEEYMKVLTNIDKYLGETTELIDVTKDSYYPIGLLGGDVHIHFLHYKSFAEAKEKWFQRISRVDRKHLYIIFVQQKGTTPQLLFDFAQLAFENKIALVNYHTKLRANEVYINGFDGLQSLGIITNYTGWSGRRYYDYFDWRKWLKV